MCAITSQLNPYLRHLIKEEAIISSRSFGSPARSIRSRILRVSRCQAHPGAGVPAARGCAAAGRARGAPGGLEGQGRGAAACKTLTARRSGLGSSSCPVHDGFDPGVGRAKVLQERGRAMDASRLWAPELSRDWNVAGVHTGGGRSSEAAADNGSFGFITAMGSSVRPFPCRRHHPLRGPFWPAVLV